ncbi:MAG: FkbM family methyltransferase [Rickettsiales bacterium]
MTREKSMISKEEAISRLREEGYYISKNRFSTRYFKSLNFKIDTLIDVGVNNGTPDLYAAFPESKMFLIDPGQINLADLKAWQKNKYDLNFIHKALGRKIGSTAFNISNISARSSVLKRLDPRKNEEFSNKKVEMVTLDSLSEEFVGNIGLKLDVEGYEAEILKGAAKTLQSVEFVIVETSISPRFENGSKFSDIVSILAKYNIELYDILTPLYKAPTYMDCLFVRFSNDLFKKSITVG